MTVDAVGFPTKEAPLDIDAGQDRQLDLTLRPTNPDVTLTADAIVLRVPLKFRPGRPRLTPVAKAELEGVAEVLIDHEEIKTLRIEAHWGGAKAKRRPKGGGNAAKTLSQRQADVVKDYLGSKGVPAGRLEAVGLGSEPPLPPSGGPASQKNGRRVDLTVVR